LESPANGWFFSCAKGDITRPFTAAAMAGVMLSSATSAPGPTPPAVLVMAIGFEIVKSGFFDPFGLKLKNEAGDSGLAFS
jgi:hypothetical protein